MKNFLVCPLRPKVGALPLHCWEQTKLNPPNTNQMKNTKSTPPTMATSKTITTSKPATGAIAVMEVKPDLAINVRPIITPKSASAKQIGSRQDVYETWDTAPVVDKPKTKISKTTFAQFEQKDAKLQAAKEARQARKKIDLRPGAVESAIKKATRAELRAAKKEEKELLKELKKSTANADCKYTKHMETNHEYFYRDFQNSVKDFTMDDLLALRMLIKLDIRARRKSGQKSIIFESAE